MIELSNVSKKFGASEVLKQLNLTIDEGDFVSIRGKSGVGKSTLLKIMGFLELPDEGEVTLSGKALCKLSDAQRSKLRLETLGFVFQFFNLLPSLTVMENIELPLALAGVSKAKRRERALELVKYFGLEKLAERFPENLSGGERQRIGIIRALVNNPKIIIADEPTSSLDDENSQLIMDLFRTINKDQKVTIVLSTTDLYEKLPTSKSYTLKNGILHPL